MRQERTYLQLVKEILKGISHLASNRRTAKLHRILSLPTGLQYANMSSFQLESLVDIRDKHGHTRYRRSIALAAFAVGSLMLGVLLLGGLSYHEQLPQILGIDPPGGLAARETSIALRPDYAVSTFLYERRTFKWYAGWAILSIASGLAIKSLVSACIVATGGVGAIPCTVAAVGGAALVAGIFLPPGGGGTTSDGVTTHDVELGDMDQFDYVTNGSKRDEDEWSHIYQLLRGSLGEDYQYVGHINGTHESHADLVARNGGKPVAVYSFTSSAGTRFHHSLITDSANGGVFHRFGFNTMDNTAASKRATEVEATNEHFSSGGLDVFACATSSKDHLVTSDSSQMESELQCNFSNDSIEAAKEIEVQVYDAVSETSLPPQTLMLEAEYSSRPHRKPLVQPESRRSARMASLSSAVSLP